MNANQRYQNPPVVEALCEIYFAGSSAWDETVPGRFYDLVKDDFPDKRQQEVHEAQVTLTTGGEAAAGVRRLAPRMQFLSEKGERLIQLGRDLLVVNHLRPYPQFEEWEPVIYSALAAYRELAQPQSVARIGLRYIDRVVIPTERILMEDYFTVHPHIPESMGEAHGRFMLRFELPPTNQHTVLITFGSTPADKPGEIAHLLDFYDIFQPANGFTFDAVRNEVRTAHDNIEAAFEASITDRLRDLFVPENAP